MAPDLLHQEHYSYSALM